MVFDLRRFLSGEKPPMNVEFSTDLSGRDFADKQVPDPVQCSFTTRLTSDGAVLTLAVGATVVGSCARCLDTIVQPCNVQQEFVVRPQDLQDPDFELPVEENGCLDVEELAYQELFLAMPPVLLCSPDCPGLCPVCGKRKDSCTCAPTADTAPADARLSILQQLLR